jgi:hypothetical protein
MSSKAFFIHPIWWNLGQLIAPKIPRAMSEWKMARSKEDGKNSVA